jgi:hypothetical protein
MIERALIRDHLRAGLTPDQIFKRLGSRREVWLDAIEEGRHCLRQRPRGCVR